MNKENFSFFNDGYLKSNNEPDKMSSEWAEWWLKFEEGCPSCRIRSDHDECEEYIHEVNYSLEAGSLGVKKPCRCFCRQVAPCTGCFYATVHHQCGKTPTEEMMHHVDS